MRIGYIGLGKMGFNMVQRLLEKGHSVTAFDPDRAALERAVAEGAEQAASPEDLVAMLQMPSVIWLMVPHQAMDSLLGELGQHLTKGDILIDGGNSFYKDSMRRSRELAGRGVHFLDAGVSGGPFGARMGACIMVGGERGVFDTLEDLFRDLAVDRGYAYMGPSGAGHFVKMVHNGIEYGMMQAIAEGFNLLRSSPFGLDLVEVADIYNHQSVIESRLVEWLKGAFAEYGEDLKGISGSVEGTGEAAWTVEAAREMAMPAPVIEAALAFRIESRKKPSYTGQILSALRNQFGGHDVFAKTGNEG